MRTLQSNGGSSAIPEELAPWFHNLHLPGGRRTAPDHPLGDFPAFKWEQIAPHLPADLRDARALDIGCNAGFYTFELARRAADVLALDIDEHYLRQAHWARDQLGLDGRVELRQMQVYDLARSDERFDLVLFMGVLYHLRHPLLALDLIHEHAARDLLVFQSMQRGAAEVEPVRENYDFWDAEQFDRPGYPKLHFVERRYANDETNWWVPNRACAEAMLRSAGFDILGRPEAEVYVCRRTEPLYGPGAVYPAKGPRA